MELDDYILLIYKELKGEISEEERVDLLDYMSGNAQAEKIYSEVETAWQGELLNDQELESDLSSLHQKMDDKAPLVKKMWPRVLKIAAVFALVSSLTVFLYQSSLKRENQIFASSNLDLELPDGSIVQVMQGSSLSYMDDFENERTIHLDGKAFFDVKSFADQPFIVKVKGAEVQVLGTEFTVDASGENVIVSVKEGRVSLRKSSEEVILSQNEVGILNADEMLIKEGLNTSNFNYWKDAQLRFQDEELKAVVRQISLIFNVDIQVERKEMETCKLSAIINADQLDQILNAISEKLNLSIKEEASGSFTLVNGECN